jgi:hypothetical protein
MLKQAALPYAVCQKYNNPSYPRVFDATPALFSTRTAAYPTLQASRLISMLHLEFIFAQGGAG